MPDIVANNLSFHYPGRRALDGVSFAVEENRLFGLLGPNGGGKTTLFRILCTLAMPTSGSATIRGWDVVREAYRARQEIGVVFQTNSIDGELTVSENLRNQGRLYGLGGAVLQDRIDRLSDQFRLRDRLGELAKKLSGGLQRRVEIAKSLLHSPRVLLLDEPSAGLDPNARYDLWNLVASIRAEKDITILITTHLMDEADRCDTLAILDRGRLVSSGTPDCLKDRIGGDVITIKTADPSEFGAQLQQRFGCRAMVVDGTVRLETQRGHEFVARLIEAFPGSVEAITVSRPTLEDVFVHETGHRFSHDPIVGDEILENNEPRGHNT